VGWRGKNSLPFRVAESGKYYANARNKGAREQGNRNQWVRWERGWGFGWKGLDREKTAELAELAGLAVLGGVGARLRRVGCFSEKMAQRCGMAEAMP